MLGLNKKDRMTVLTGIKTLHHSSWKSVLKFIHLFESVIEVVLKEQVAKEQRGREYVNLFS